MMLLSWKTCALCWQDSLEVSGLIEVADVDGTFVV